MSDPVLEDVKELYDRVALVLAGNPANLIGAVLSNLIAATALETMPANEPYSIARVIYQNAKLHIKANLDAQGIMSKRPKGMKPN